MGFKKIRSVRLTYNEQGLIYFICHNYKNQETIEKIESLIGDICGTGDEREKERAALRRAITTDESIRRVAIRYGFSEKKIYCWRTEFFNRAKAKGIINHL